MGIGKRDREEGEIDMKEEVGGGEVRREKEKEKKRKGGRENMVAFNDFTIM